MKIVFFFTFLIDKTGFPIFPPSLTSNLCFNKISYKSWQVVDLPFVPVIVIQSFL